jgi:hypothetical protein
LPYVIRHDKSGVWVCYVIGRGKIWPDALLIEGRRIWGWSGGRLECSQLATQGVVSGKLGDWVRTELVPEGRVEAIVSTEAVVEATRGLPVWSG